MASSHIKKPLLTIKPVTLDLKGEWLNYLAVETPTLILSTTEDLSRRRVTYTLIARNNNSASLE